MSTCCCCSSSHLLLSPPPHFTSSFSPHSYAKWLGMESNEDDELGSRGGDLRWICREALKAPLPKHWKHCDDPVTGEYFYNFTTGEKSQGHPCDLFYKRVYEEEKRKKASSGDQWSPLESQTPMAKAARLEAMEAEATAAQAEAEETLMFEKAQAAKEDADAQEFAETQCHVPADVFVRDMEGVMALSYALSTNRTLTALSLSANALRAEGVAWLAKGLARNRALQSLSLDLNSLTTYRSDGSGLSKLLEAMGGGGGGGGGGGAGGGVGDEGDGEPPRRTLSLRANGLGLEGAICVVNALADGSCLAKVDLTNNQIDPGHVRVGLDACTPTAAAGEGAGAEGAEPSAGCRVRLRLGFLRLPADRVVMRSPPPPQLPAPPSPPPPQEPPSQDGPAALVCRRFAGGTRSARGAASASRRPPPCACASLRPFTTGGLR